MSKKSVATFGRDDSLFIETCLKDYIDILKVIGKDSNVNKIVYDKIKAILKVIEIANQESNKVEKQENKVIGDETTKTGPCD